MTLLEYLQSVAPERVLHWKHGRLLIDASDFFNGWSPDIPIEQQRERNRKILEDEKLVHAIGMTQDILEAVMDDIEDCHGVYAPNADEMKRLSDIELRLDPGIDKYQAYARRPYYQMRGRKVTPEQARDIIRRTDEMIGMLAMDLGRSDPSLGKEIRNGDYIGGMNFNQWWFMRNHYPTHYGWSHPSGVIGSNAITQKYPNFREFLSEMLKWKIAFPYLDLMIAVSNCDEEPETRGWARDELYRKWGEKMWKELPETEMRKRDEEMSRLNYMDSPEFPDDLGIGICTHDNVIEFLNPENAGRRYREYEARYGVEDPKVYVPEYYQDRKLLVCGNAYLIRCLMDYGMTEGQAWELVEKRG